MSPAITRRTFLAAVRCERLGNLGSREPPAPESRGQRLRNEEQLELLEKCRSRFPGGVQVTGSLRERVKRTGALMADQTTTAIFDAAVEAGPLTDHLDMLSRNGPVWNVTQVCADFAGRRTTGHDQVTDLAYSAMVLRRAGIPTGDIGLLLLARDFRLGDPEDYLLSAMDLTAKVVPESHVLEQIADHLVAQVQRDDTPAATLKQPCMRCRFFLTRCLGKNARHPVTQLPGITSAKTRSLFSAGILETQDIPAAFPLSTMQARATTAVKSQATFVSEMLGAGLDALPRPHTYLRIDCMTAILPVYEGWRCLNPMPTQFSARRRESNGGSQEHHHFLCDHRRDESRELTERLLRVLPTEGTIIVYTEHEKRVLRKMTNRCPDLLRTLAKIRKRVCILRDLVQQYIYDPGFRGEFTLKTVCASLLPEASSEQVPIPDDTEAHTLFAELTRDEAGDTGVNRRALTRNCSNYTLALSRLHERLLDMARACTPSP